MTKDKFYSAPTKKFLIEKEEFKDPIAATFYAGKYTIRKADAFVNAKIEDKSWQFDSIARKQKILQGLYRFETLFYCIVSAPFNCSLEKDKREHIKRMPSSLYNKLFSEITQFNLEDGDLFTDDDQKNLEMPYGDQENP